MKSSDFDLQPWLQGELIWLRPLVLDDFEDLYQVASDPMIWEQHPQRDRYKKEVFAEFFEKAIQSKGALAVIDGESGKIIGSSRYYDLAPAGDRVNVGYTFLARLFWGGRFNRELKALMLGHAFRYVGSVAFEIGESNLRSRRAVEKIGARVAERRELEGRVHLVYRISESEFRGMARP